MKQKSIEKMAAIFFNMTIIENLTKRMDKPDIAQLVRATEDALYWIVIDEGERDVFRVKLDKIFGDYKKTLDEMKETPKAMIELKSMYNEKRLKKLLLKSEERR